MITDFLREGALILIWPVEYGWPLLTSLPLWAK